jgi:signal transduction histidine kinase
VTQILTNLLDNAFHYTPEGGEITISAWVSENSVVISIEDTGIGITEKELSNVFSRFYRSERNEVQQVPGTGLGLAIVRSLVEMHGGDIWVESTPGSGSTFTFSLPLTSRPFSNDTSENVQFLSSSKNNE